MTYPVQPNADPNDLLNGEREIGIAWHEFPADHLNRYQFTRSLLTRQATVLDVGCGVGYGRHLLAKVAKQVIGLDYRPHVIDYAQKHWGGPIKASFVAMLYKNSLIHLFSLMLSPHLRSLSICRTITSF